MPVVLRVGPYRIGFFSNENDEPPHVHVYRERAVAKLWLNPRAELASSRGFPRHELTLIRRIIQDNRELLLKSWNEFHHED
jgi:hypothetical protein